MKSIIILVLVVVAVGLVAYGFVQSKNNQSAEENRMEITDDKMEGDKMMEDDKVEDGAMMEDDSMEKEGAMMEDDKVMAKGGEYVDYSPELLARADSGKVVLFFHAAWCPTCKALEKSILNGDIPSDLTILKINYDTASELKDKYDIVIQHTLIQVDSNGNEITKWVGGNDLASIESKLK